MNFKCMYCNKEFFNKYTLQNHINTAKYCIKLRDNFDKNIKEYICEYCNKNFTSQQNLDNHISKCNNKKESDKEDRIKELKERIFILENKLKQQEEFYENKLKEQQIFYENKISILQDKIENLAITAIKRPTVQNTQQRYNTIINNLTPITEDHLKEQAQYLTIDHIKNGVDGYVKYALEYPLKDKIVCTDFSRRKIKYKDEEGNIIEDPEMLNLTQKLFQAIKDKNSQLVSEYILELKDKFDVLVMEPNYDMDDEESEDYGNRMNIVTDDLFKIKDQKKEIEEIANGNKNEIYYRFIKDVCSKTLKNKNF